MVSDSSPEMKVSRKQPIRFYIRAAEAFFRGVCEGTKKNGDKIEKKEPVTELTISGLGNAINTAIACATNLERNELAEVVSVNTDYCIVKGGGKGVDRRSPQIQIQLKRNPDAQTAEDLKAAQEAA